MPPFPTGRQVDISRGHQHISVVEAGGGLRTYTVAGEDVLDGYAADEMCSSGRGQSLIPWPNRLEGGSYDFDGATYHVALTEPSHGNAIHGLTRFANWVVGEQGSDYVVMTHRLHPHPGYPFLLDLTLTYRLADDGLTVTSSATNRGTMRCPYGTGAHPYFRIGAGLIDSLTLRSPASVALVADDRGIPVGRRSLDGEPDDFRQARPLGDLALDTGYTGLSREGNGRAVVRLTEPATNRRLDVWMDEGYEFVMVFTGDTLAPDRKRKGLAVEPMTCAPNAFRSGDGLLVIDPGDTHTAEWGVTPSGYSA